jgi:hypothetical protein
MNAQFLIGTVLGSAMLASAHLGTLTAPKANDSFAAGASVNVRWSVATPHNTQDLAYSTNGTTWTSITTGLGANVNSFNWTVPAIKSTTVRFRVCQRDGGGGCTDAHNTSSPSRGIALAGGGEVYTVISGNFTVTEASTAIHSQAAVGAPRIGFDGASRSVNAVFRLDASGKVLLEAFDAQGRLLVTLVDKEMAVGEHDLSVFSNRLPAAGTAVIRLQAGAQATQASFSLVR